MTSSEANNPETTLPEAALPETNNPEAALSETNMPEAALLPVNRPDRVPPGLPPVELQVFGFAAGGDGLARGDDGKVVFVAGVVPGERVRVELTETRRDFARGEVLQVIEAARERVDPACPYVASGCGGCDWQHVEPAAQPGFKVGIVADALRRLGGIEQVAIVEGPVLSSTGYRTTVRLAGAGGGRGGYRLARSHELVAVDRCQVAHPLLDELIREADFGAAKEVTLRCGARTGERMIVANPTTEGFQVPEDVTVVGLNELKAGRRVWIHEEVAGRRWRFSARSFFQDRPDGAEALVDAVQAGVGVPADVGGGDGRLVDLFGGVGLFAGTVDPGWKVELVEWSASSVADARVNLADRNVRIHRLNVTSWRPSPADVVIADPPRTGLKAPGVRAIAMTGAVRVVLVSCDPAALARDAALLQAEGYGIESVTVIDLFPQTSHIETVAVFGRG